MCEQPSPVHAVGDAASSLYSAECCIFAIRLGRMGTSWQLAPSLLVGTT